MNSLGNKISIKTIKNLSLLGLTAFLIWAGLKYLDTLNNKPTEQEVILDWYEFALECDRYAEGYKGAISARTFAYLGIANAEIAKSVHPISLDFIQNKRNYPSFPNWTEKYDLYLPAALNAAFAFLFEMFYSSVPMHLKDEIHAKRNNWHSNFSENVDDEVLHQSRKYGKEIATIIFEYAATDSIGHNAHLFNYDKDFKFEDQLGVWSPCRSFPMPPLLPYWGKARTFIAHPIDFIAQPLPEFSYENGSVFHRQALEVFTINSPLSDENQWIAEFWSDDHNSSTFTPAGRWISITNQILRREEVSTVQLLDLYLNIGLVLNDAFVSCWYSKYHYNLMRPETYIQNSFDRAWHSHYHSPSFPSYPSGHSFAGAACAQILAHTFGNNYAMEDRSHAGRKDFKGKPRLFKSFDEMAKENAISRVLLGVHFRMDSEEGLRLGRELGDHFISVRENKSNAIFISK